jgi:glutamate-ammonia-ligase adenylyltransferase
MKRRIERERSRQPERYLKLGPGGLSDIEFTVQMQQLLHAGRDPSLRTTSTLGAIRALAAAGLLESGEAADLEAGWDLQSRLRNRQALRGVSGADRLPSAPAELDAVAQSLRFDDGAALLRALQARRTAVRAVFARRFLA